MKAGIECFSSVSQMLEKLSWIPLSKRRENSRLSVFYKHYQQFGYVTTFMRMGAPAKNMINIIWHISYNVGLYGQCFSQLYKCVEWPC